MAPLGPVKFLTIHCSATPEGRPVTFREVNQWDTAKFGQVSYHWVVELDGTAHQTIEDSYKGAHVGGHNTGNIGICYVGGMDAKMKAPKDTRTKEQKDALLKLVREYKKKYPGIVIRGHKDWPGVKKACPSFSVSAWLKEVGE